MSLFLFLIIYYLIDVNYDSLISLLSNTSFQDRIERNFFAIQVLKNASISNLLFGHGINSFPNYSNDELGRGLSSGFLYLFFENGIIYSCLVLFLLVSISNKNLTLLLISMFYLVAIPWYKYYFCWYAIILCGLNYYNYKKPVNESKLKNNNIIKDRIS